MQMHQVVHGSSESVPHAVVGAHDERNQPMLLPLALCQSDAILEDLSGRFDLSLNGRE
jgi:hypothetical protein